MNALNSPCWHCAKLREALQRIIDGFNVSNYGPYRLGEDKPMTKADAVRVAQAALKEDYE